MRSTEGKRQNVLDDKEGSSAAASYRGGRFQEDRTCSMVDGKPSIRAKGTDGVQSVERLKIRQEMQ